MIQYHLSFEFMKQKNHKRDKLHRGKNIIWEGKKKKDKCHNHFYSFIQ